MQFVNCFLMIFFKKNNFLKERFEKIRQKKQKEDFPPTLTVNLKTQKDTLRACSKRARDSMTG